MVTAPFGPALETALKQPLQGGRLTLLKDRLIWPSFFCCDTGGGYFGVAKDPVAVLIVSPTRACAGDNVNADYSKSWSSFSTIASWSIDWGDGNSSSGAWPGPPWDVDHPAGGYAIPATYTITLTVTDLLGASGEDSQQVEIIDCSTGPGIGLFAGCGGSGVWYSSSAGLDWGERGGGVLEGVKIYDLKVHPFTLGAEKNELWAATENGLYKSVDSGESWQAITLPDPDGGTNYPVGVSIVCSVALPNEVYVLGYRTVPSNQVWLFRTEDSGETWTWVTLGTPDLTVSEINWGAGGVSAQHGIAEHGGDMYCCWSSPGMGANAKVYRRNPLTQTWNALGTDPDMFTGHIVSASGYLYCAGRDQMPPWGADISLQRWTGAAWQSSVRLNQTYDDICALGGGRICCATAQVVDFYIGLNYTATTPAIPSGNIRTIGNHHGTLIAFTTDGCIYRYGAGAWTQEASGYGDFRGSPALFDGDFYVCTSASLVLKRESGTGTWSTEYSCPAAASGAFTSTDSEDEERLMVGGVNFIAEKRSGIWSIVVSGPAIGGNQVFYDGANNDLLFAAGATINRVAWGAATVSAVGRTHLTTMVASGWYVLVGIVANTGFPLILRVAYDLSSLDAIYVPAAGTWGGVKADHNDGARVWIFGDFGAASKVLCSDDWGNGWNDVTEGTWNANEIVRPVMPSVYDGADLVVILSVAQESWHTGDDGVTWAKTGDTVFGVHCGERDWIEDENIFIGRVNAGADHLQFSPNKGHGWAERSSGITPNTEITAIQVVS